MITVKFDMALLKQPDSKIRKITTDEITEIRHRSETDYQTHYKPYLYCPECGMAQIIHCDRLPNPYIKSIRISEHPQECSYATPPLESDKFYEYYDEKDNFEGIKNRLDKALDTLFLEKKTGNNPFILEHDDAIKASKSTSVKSSEHKKRIKRSLPRKLLSNSFDKDDFDVIKFFYGKVHIHWKFEKRESPKESFYYLFLHKIGSSELLCRLRISLDVYSYLPDNYKIDMNCYIVFMAKIRNKEDEKSGKFYKNSSLRSSYHISIKPIPKI